MPARSKAQQRLFGMVHAYNKGEFHGSRSLRNRVAALSRRISDTDAQHFAKTPHDGLPEKKAQALVRPDAVNDAYEQYAPAVYQRLSDARSSRRRSFLGTVLRGTVVGTAAGGLGAGVLGALIARSVARDAGITNQDVVISRVLDAGSRMAAWGAGRGAAGGALVGAGLGIFDKIRGNA